MLEITSWLVVLTVLPALVLSGCGVSRGSAAVSSTVALSPQAQLGKQLFFDASLSASGTISCATCHDPAHAFAQPSNRDAVPMGGQQRANCGFRNAPSLCYQAWTPPFVLDIKDGKVVPTGGFTRDGRVSTLSDQARLPLLAAHEMANGTAAEFTARLARTSYVSKFQAVFGEDILNDPEAALARAALALQQFQIEDTGTFASFTSKYDRFLRKELDLTPAEKHGLALFEDTTKGNCAACHPNRPSGDGSPPLFTDFTYDNIGVPRNRTIPANEDGTYFDLGLCGPFRKDLAERKEFCGAFKVPTLRNVALTAPYLHNGRFATLREVVEFYVTRDTSPEKWYRQARKHSVVKFDDLPEQYVRNVNTSEVPYNRHPGDDPALSSAEIDDLVAFLQTLTDGYRE